MKDPYMGELHRSLAKALASKMIEDPSAAVFDVVRRFLADNNITEDGTQPGSAVEPLTAALPFVDRDRHPSA